MSGHSKWSTIKRKKGANDAKRGKIFTRLGKEITIAARDGGGDPESNSSLRTAVANARAQNMPKDNIDRAIKRGTGEIDGARFEEISYEGYGPGGVAILVSTVTDNTNRTAADVRHVFNKYGGKMGVAGSVGYLFETKGIILVEEAVADEEKVMEVVIDAGAEDVAAEDGVVQVTTPREGLHSVLGALEESSIAVVSAELTPVPSTVISVSGKEALGLLKLINYLDDLDDTSSVSANFDIPEEEMAAIQEELGMIRILGLDPGSLNLGYGLVESDKGRLRHVAHGTLRAPKSQPLPGRLALLYEGLQKVLEEFPPDAVALERVFTARNPHSALTLGHARGVVLLAVGQRQLELAEYSPGEVKLAVGGHGRASKHQLAQMVGRLLEVSTKDMSSDSSDALAIAICHCHGLARSRLLARVERSR